MERVFGSSGPTLLLYMFMEWDERFSQISSFLSLRLNRWLDHFLFAYFIVPNTFN